MNYRSQNAKDDRSVGYKKPPRESQFKKGQSGNRKGRPRQLTRSKSIAQMFREVAGETVEIEGEGGPLTMMRWEALVRQIHNMALNKDASAARLIHQLRKQFPGRLPEGDPIPSCSAKMTCAFERLGVWIRVMSGYGSYSWQQWTTNLGRYS